LRILQLSDRVKGVTTKQRMKDNRLAKKRIVYLGQFTER